MSFVEHARKTAEYDLGKKETLEKVREAIEKIKKQGSYAHNIMHDFEKELGLSEVKE